MAAPLIFAHRNLRIKYWNHDPKVVDNHRMVLEVHLKKLGDLHIQNVDALDDSKLLPCDLLVIGAHLIEEVHFATWLKGVRKRLIGSGAIWAPALIVSDISFEGLREILPEAVADNWYFDIIAPRHLSSLPIRVANLLRIHDHLHEIKRYSEAIDDINQKVAHLEQKLEHYQRQEQP